MAIRRNKKRIDPRYFLNETTYRDEIEEGSEHDAEARGMAAAGEEGEKAGKAGKTPRLPNDPEYMRGYKKGKDEGKEEIEEGFVGQGTAFDMSDDVLSTKELGKLMDAGYESEDLRNLNRANLTPKMKDALEGKYPTYGADKSVSVLSTDDLFKLFNAGIAPEDLRGVDNDNLTPEMVSILHSAEEDAEKWGPR